MPVINSLQGFHFQLKKTGRGTRIRRRLWGSVSDSYMENGADILSVSVYPSEDEVLLAPCSKFKVTDVKVSKGIPIVILHAC